MSGTVDTRTVEMRFDNKNFESNVKQSMSTLDKLKRKLKLDGASRSLKEVEESSKKLDFKETRSSVKKLEKGFSALEAIATGVFMRIGMKAADLGEKILKSFTVDNISAGWNKYADKTTSVQTIMANIKDDESKFIDEASKMSYVTRQLEKLMWFSDETSYSFTDMTGNVGKFIATGSGLEDSVVAMQGIATWAAMAGQNAQTASRVMYQISQAMGTGKMTLMDWKSIETANMGTAQFKELAISIGEAQNKIKKGAVTVADFRNSLQKGWFDKSVMLEVFKTYGEAADKIREYAATKGVETSEAIEELKKNDEEFAESLGFKAFAAAQEAKTFAEVVGSVADAASTKWTKFFEYIFGDYLQAKKLWTDLSNDLYGIFIEPLNSLNAVMEVWNRGFIKDGPANVIDKAFEQGVLKDLASTFEYVTEEAAQQAVELDSSVYSIKEATDGTKVLLKRIKDADGSIRTYYKNIFDPKNVLSGRESLINGFRNIMEGIFTGYTDSEGNEVLSVLQTIKEAFRDIFFPEDDTTSLAKRLWDLTKRFEDFSKKLKPSQEILDKIKNTFKGFFTVFKIAKEFIKAVLEPLKKALKTLLGGNIPDGLLTLADTFATWIKNLEGFLKEAKIFEKVSNGISNGLDTISKALTGLSFNDWLAKVRQDILGFFNNFDFKTLFESVSKWLSEIDVKGIFSTLVGILKFGIDAAKDLITDVWNFLNSNDFQKLFSNISEWLKSIDFKAIFLAVVNVFKSIINFVQKAITEISQLNSEELPEKLTPIQNFWLGLKGIFNSVKSVLPTIIGVFEKAIKAVSKVITEVSQLNSEKLPDKLTPIQSLWLWIKSLFKSLKSIVGALSGPFKKVAAFISQLFSKIAEFVSKADKTGDEVAAVVEKDKKVLDRVTELFKGVRGFLKKAAAIAKKNNEKSGTLAVLVKGFVDLLKGLVYLLDSLIPIIGKIGTVIGIIFTAIGNVIRKITKNADSKKAALIIVGLLAILGIFVVAGAIIWRIKKHIEWVKDGLNAIRDLIEGVGLRVEASARAKTLNAITRMIIAVSIAIGAIGGALSLMTKAVKDIGLGKFIVIAAILAVFLAGIMAVVLFAYKGVKNGVKTEKALTRFIGVLSAISGFMLSVAGSLILLSVAFGMMSGVVNAIGLGKTLGIAGILIVFFGAFAAIALFAYEGVKNGVKTEKALARFIGVLSAISGFMLSVAGSLILLSVAFGIMSGIDPKKLGWSALIFGVYIAVVSGIAIGLIALFKKIQIDSIQKIIVGMAMVSGFMIAAAVSLIIVAEAFSRFASINFSNSSLLSVSLVFLGFMVVAGGLAVAGRYLLSNVKAIIGVALMSGFLVTAAVSLWIAANAFAKLAEVPENKMLAVVGIVFAFFLIVAGLAAVGAVLANTGVGAAGMALIALIIGTIGFACIAASAGMALMISSITGLIEAFIVLMQAVQTYGPSFIDTLGVMFDAALVKIGESKENMKNAFFAVVVAIAEAIIKAAPVISDALVILLVYVMKNVSDTINASTDMIAYTLITFLIQLIYSLANNIRLYAPELINAVRQIIEAIIEVIILALAAIAETIPGFGKKLAKRITDWIPSVREAFGTIDENNVLKKVAENNLELAKSGVIAGNAITDLSRKFSSLFSSTDEGYDGLLSSLFGGFGANGVTSFFDGAISDTKDGMEGITDAIKNETPEMQRALKDAFDTGELDDIKNKYSYVSRAAAEKAIETDPNSYSITTTTEGVDLLVKKIKTANGQLKYSTKTIYDNAVEDSDVFDQLISKMSSISDFSDISGADMIANYISGMESKFPDLETAVGKMQSIVEGDGNTSVGPALNYVSGLIDGGMSDDRNVSPVYSSNSRHHSSFSRLSTAGSYLPTANVPAEVGDAINRSNEAMNNVSNAINTLSEKGAGVYNYYNTFNITNENPDEVAKTVVRYISNQTVRKSAVYGTPTPTPTPRPGS